MKPSDVLRIADEVLSLHRKIVGAHVRHRHDAAVLYFQTHNAINRDREEIVQRRMAVQESLVRAHLLRPKKQIDDVERIEQRERRVLADLAAKANIRAAVEQRFRAQAAKAALDRASFIQEVKSTLPEEIWQETIDLYDRSIYEATQEGSQ